MFMEESALEPGVLIWSVILREEVEGNYDCILQLDILSVMKGEYNLYKEP